jgi:ADP-heptose:LPS heptosyltransferase
LKILDDNLLKKREYVCFQTGSKSNAWPIGRFESVAKEISARYPVILLGTKEEKEQNDKIEGKNIISMCGKLSLRETIYLLKEAKFSICNDSGIAHMSCAIGTATIVLFGPHSPKHCSPKGIGKAITIYNYDGKFPYAKRGSIEGMERIESITIEDVMQAISQNNLM